MAPKTCNNADSHTPCPSALHTLRGLRSGETMSGRVIQCPHCGRQWKFEYYATGGEYRLLTVRRVQATAIEGVDF